jgi:hypothetical protein
MSELRMAVLRNRIFGFFGTGYTGTGNELGTRYPFAFSAYNVSNNTCVKNYLTLRWLTGSI